MDNITNTLAYTISVDGIQDLLTQLGQLEQAMAGVSSDFDQTNKQGSILASGLDDLSDSYSSLADKIDDGVDSSAKYQVAYSKVITTLQQASTAAKSTTSSLSDLSSQSLTATNQLKSGFTKNMQDIKTSIADAAGGYNSFKTVIGDVGVALTGQGKTMEDVLSSNEDAMASAQERFSSIGEVVEGQVNDLDLALKGLQPLNSSLITDKANTETQQAASQIGTTIKQLQTQLQGLSAPDSNSESSGSTLLSAVGLDKVGETQFKQKLGDAQQAVSQSAQTIGSIFTAQKNQRLADLQDQENKEIQQVQSSTLNEQQKATAIAKIKQDAANTANQIEVAAKKEQQKLDIVTSIINTAIAVGKALATAPPPFNAILAVIAAAQGAAQTAVIASQKFAQGGYLPFEEGGLIQGPSHSAGGVPFLSGGKLMEAQGGELIVNRNIWSRPDFVKTISQMNAFTGGRNFFATGGIVPTPLIPGVYTSSSPSTPVFDSDAFLKGLRGVIANEVGSLKVINNVVDTTYQQNRIINQQANGTF